MAVPPLDVVGDIPLLFELGGYGDGLIVDCLHAGGGIAFEDDITLARVVAIANEHTLFILVGPISLDLGVVIGGDDVLLADLAAGYGVGLETFPDCFGIGVEIVGLG